jgi:serine/threonine protein phosphatase PrpC
MELESYARSETGPVREHNEDAWQIDLSQGVFVVADGMGGHAAGEVASKMAVETVVQALVGAPDPDETRLVRDHESQDPADILRERLRYAMNQASIRIRTGWTTCTAWSPTSRRPASTPTSPAGTSPSRPAKWSTATT